MDQSSLVNDLVTAGERFVREFEKHYPIEAALWVKPNDTGRWSLYIVSPAIDVESKHAAYQEVVRIGAAMNDPNFSPFQVTLGTVSDDLARFASDLRQRYPGRVIYRDSGITGTLNGRTVDEVRIYPILAAATTN